MTPEHASVIASLICNAGYADDANEIFGDWVESGEVMEAMAFAQSLDELIAEINPLLPEMERIETNRTMVEEVKLAVESNS